MSKQQKISKLDYSTDFGSKDLLLLTRQGINALNFKVEIRDFVEYYKNYAGGNSIFPFEMKETYLDNNGADETVSETSVSTGDIETIKFDEYGCITSITKKVQGITYQEINAVGTVVTTKSEHQVNGEKSNYGNGYFDKNTRVKSFYETNKLIVGGSYLGDTDLDKVSDYIKNNNNWDDFFNLKYTGFKKTEIEYTLKKIDDSGSNEGDSRFHIEIFWNGKDKCKVLGVGMVPTGYTNTSTNGAFMNTVLYSVTQAKDNEFILNSSDADYSNFDIKPDNEVSKLQLKNQYQNARIKINGENQQILALPIRPWVPKGDVETHAISINVKSFA